MSSSNSNKRSSSSSFQAYTFIMSSLTGGSSSSNCNSAQEQHADQQCSNISSAPQESDDGAFHDDIVSRDSLVALDFLDQHHKGPILPSSKSWSSLTGFSEDSTAPALTDCSSRSSLQDLDLSFDEFSIRDPASSGYFKRLGDEDDVRLNRHPFLPSVLSNRRAPRAVSFACIEEVFDYSSSEDESETKEDEGGGILHPKTPVIEWYSSKGSSSRKKKGRRGSRQQQLPPLFPTGSGSHGYSSPMKKPPMPPTQAQPKRSAMKKSDATSATTATTTVHQYPPSSPRVTWYSSAPKN